MTPDILNVFFLCLAGTQTVLDAEVTEGIHFILFRRFSSDNRFIFQHTSKPFLEGFSLLQLLWQKTF